MKRIIKEFKEALTTKTGTSAYDTTAEVIRVEGSTLWVHIPGGVDETPIRKTVDAKAGDTVQVRVGGGSAWATGNASAPPTDDSAAKVAKKAADDANKRAGGAWDIADEAMDAADDAWNKADFALRSANGKNTVYYSASEPTAPETGFKVGDTWFDTANDYQINEWDGSDWVPFQLGEDAIADLAITNAKIANATIQSAKIAGLDVGKLTGGYIDAGHINTRSLSVGGGRTLGDELDDMSDEIDDVYPYMTYVDSTYGVRVYRGDKSNATNRKYYSQMNAGGFDVVANDVTLAHIGYGSGTSASGTAIAPYYNFGVRTNGSTIGNYSIAEGNNSTASGYCSHAEGWGSEATNDRAHAEGYDTVASGANSHAQNACTIAAKNSQTAIGKYNIEDTSTDSYGAYAFIIGNGRNNNSRSNALTVDWDGKLFTNQIQAGTIAQTTVGGNSYVDVPVTFPKSMSGTPVVTVSLISNSTAGAFGNVSAAVLRNSESTTGFTCRIHNADTSSRMPAVSWIAMNVGTP